MLYSASDPDQGLGDSACRRHHVLQGEGRHVSGGQRGRLQRLCSPPGRYHPQKRARDKKSGRYPLREGVYCSGDEGQY